MGTHVGSSAEAATHRRYVRLVSIVLIILAASLVVGVGRAFAYSFAPHADFATGNYPISVAAADFNGDGYLDLVAACYSSNTVSVLRGDGS